MQTIIQGTAPPEDRFAYRIVPYAGSFHAERRSSTTDNCSAAGVERSRGYTVTEAFVCRECGEGVSVERLVQ